MPKQLVSLQAYLTRLIWLCVLPLFFLAAGYGAAHIRAMQADRDRTEEHRARNIMDAVDRIITSQLAALQVLAASPLLDDPERWGEFYREARGFFDSFGCHVALADTSQQTHLYTRIPFGASPLPKVPRSKGYSSMRAALDNGVSSVGNLAVGRVAHEPLVGAIVPVVREGRARFVLISVIPARLFRQYLDSVAAPPEWTLTLFDGNGDVIARRSPAGSKDPFAGRGDARRFPAKSAASHWSLTVEVPPGVYRAPVVAATLALLAAILFFTLAGVLGGRLAGRRLTRAVAALADGSPPPSGSASVAEIEAARNALDAAAAAQKTAESTLRESEERYRNLLEAAPVAIVVHVEGKMAFVNPAGLRMVGAESRDRVIGKPAIEFIHPDGRARALARLERMLAGEKGLYPAEEVFLKLDGTPVDVELIATPVVFEGKNAIQSIVTDITRRKKAERALTEEAIRRRILIEQSGDGIVVLDQDGGIFEANRRFAEMIGYTPEEVLRLRVWDWDKLFTRTEILRMLRNVGEDGLHFETQHRRKDGTWIDMEISANGAVFGERKLVFCVCRDVTARKKTEAALEAGEKEYRRLYQQFNALLDAIPDSIMLLDRDRKILWANRPTADAVGTPKGSLAGRICHEFWCGEEKPCDPCPIARTFSSGGPVSETITDSGGRIWDVRTVPLHDAAGEIENVIALRRDITEHSRLEAQYLQAQKMESIGTLAGGVAHDFNNILTAIIGYGHMALMEMAEDDPRRLNIRSMLDAADRAAHLTKELLLFSRKQATERRPVDLDDVVRKVAKFLKRVIGEDIECRMDLHGAAGGAGAGAAEGRPEGDRLTVLADPLQLEQVLMNLATNARDAMPQGGTLSLETARIFMDNEFIVAHGFGKPGPYALLTVSDTGKGMDGETLGRIFEPFFTTKEVGKGTGLGLAVAYGIVRQHEGFINAYSEPGHGTTFRIYLPIHARASAGDAPAPPQETPAGGAETILVAEDDEALRELAGTVLEKFGYTVVEAADGEEAVRKFLEHGNAVRLLVMDLVMPKMDGKKAYDEMSKARPGVKVIFVSGYAPDHIRQRMQLDGNTRILQKPISPADLLKEVRSVLDGKE
jgi:PAS domain S-box-containing protein